MPAAEIRKLGPDSWVECHASGSLRKAKRLGLSWRNLYLEERCCHEWGWAFRILPRTRITFGDAIMEGDCHPLTEACWHAERILALNPFPDSDVFEVKYLQVEDRDGSHREGVGVVLRSTSAGWVPQGHLVFAVIAEYDTNLSEWIDAENPK